ncbi:gasdermin-A-like [Chiloscyllium punctatum]|uniref:gasdermin-A-like n=1 Tax=Chiloscyllium punctatum TaxID=137246 RepID=UPI003B640FC7
MFHKATQKIVNEIDPYGSTLIPATSPYFSDDFKPLHIIKKKKRTWFFTKDKYIPTSITLADILKDGKDLDIGSQTSNFSGYAERSSFYSSGEVDASVCTVDAGVHASGGVADIISTVEMKKRVISEMMLLEATKDRKINRRHHFVKHLRNNIFHIILEVVETDRPCDLNSLFKAQAGVEVPTKIMKAKGRVDVALKQNLSFPAGTTIAFKVLKLWITEDDTLDIFWDQLQASSCAASCYQKPELPLTELTKLSKDVSQLFLNTFLQLLGNNDNLPVLETMLDQICEGFQPDLQVLGLMEDENRACVEKLLDLLGIRKVDPPGQPLSLTPHQNEVIKTVNIFIQSLNELNLDIFTLLATSVEMKIISRQLKTLEKIEERFFICFAPEMQIDPAEETLETLALQFTESEFEITQGILEEFGFHLKREDTSISFEMHHMNKNMFCSIFAALSVLKALDDQVKM